MTVSFRHGARVSALSRPRPDLWEARGEIPRADPAVKRRDGLITSSKDGRDECKRSADEASKGFLDDTKTGVFEVSWEKHGRYLLTIHAVSGVQAA